MVICWHLFAVVQLLMLHQASCSLDDSPPQAKGKGLEIRVALGDSGLLPEQSAGIGYAYGRGGGKGKGWGQSHRGGGDQGGDQGDVCGELFLYDAPVPTVTYRSDTCTTPEGVMPHAECFGGCTAAAGEEVTGTEYWPNDYNVPPVSNCSSDVTWKNSSCCAPSCYQTSEMTIQCDYYGEQTFAYFVPTQCQCSQCSEVSGPNILFYLDYPYVDIHLYIDGIDVGLPFAVEDCILPANITISCTNGGRLLMAVITLKYSLTDASWFCSRDGGAFSPAVLENVIHYDGLDLYVITHGNGNGPSSGWTLTCSNVGP